MGSAELTGGEALRQLVDEYRGRCLWFLRPDYYPDTPAGCHLIGKTQQAMGLRVRTFTPGA